MVKAILRLEGLFIFLSSLYFYWLLDASWILFVLLWIIPDISLIGYLKNKQVGTITYNLVHNYIFALILLFYGFIFENSGFTTLGVIFTSHVGLDRFCGFGLKYPNDFKKPIFKKPKWLFNQILLDL